MSFFRITLMRSGIGLTKRTGGVLKALGLRTRMKTVFYPVTPEVAELRAERRPDPGFYMEKAAPR
ncbi:related to ribosomal protein L30 [Rhynchosporium graminicola]|uniref:Related to ribosomal protein L30 n=1 Tax=Rhynchosporium graminicola TaxID=2792576 RepID=A0A1E1JQ99_9HELO|nr:related to ribosomal protein L30 [Rhynchosporium commune]